MTRTGQSRPRGRRRRTKAEIVAFDEAIRTIAERVQPATCRQVYYRAVVAALVDKDDRGYRLVRESLSRQRWAGDLSWDWIVDETRAVRMPHVWADANKGIAAFAETYRRDVWRSQPSWVEVWCESDSLAGTLIEVTWELGIPLYSGRGFSSLSSLRSAAKQILRRLDRAQPTHILYVGDLDPSGWEAGKAAKRVLLKHLDDLFRLEADPADWVDFSRLAVNPEDVDDYELPTGAAPKKRGPGSVSWWEAGGPQLPFTIEAEAFEPARLRDLVRDSILDLADVDALDRELRQQDREQFGLVSLARTGLSNLDRYSNEAEP